MGLAAHLILTLLVGTLAGWVGHWALHQRWAGRFAKAHLVHHRLYPPHDFLSAEYRDAKGSDTTLFLAPFITIVMLAWLAALALIGVEWYVFVAILVVGIEVGILHELVHKALHLEHHWLEKYPAFRKLRTRHLQHHKYTQKNLGIVWYGWDRVFRTIK